MASTLLIRTLRRNSPHTLTPHLPNPSRIFSPKFPFSKTSSNLQTRSHTDIPHSPPPKPPENPTPPNRIGKNGSSTHKTPFSSSLNDHELSKFSAIAETWWDSEGPFRPLHLMNPTRISFIRSTLCRHFGKDPYCARPFEGLKIIDVGCGGGILSEPLARMGATVTGIDAAEKNIKIARLHAGLDPLTSSIEYCCTTAEQLVEEQRKFDVVIALEVIEHVADPSEFCKSLAALTVSNGATIISTINRSMRSYATAIIAAEYILNWGAYEGDAVVGSRNLGKIINSMMWPWSWTMHKHTTVMIITIKKSCRAFKVCRREREDEGRSIINHFTLHPGFEREQHP